MASKVDAFNLAAPLGNLFSGLPETTLEIIHRTQITNAYKRGQYVFYAGNISRGLYYVNSGIVKLEAEGHSGVGRILRLIPAGGVLGYRSLFADEAYNASAVVHEDAVICFIPKTAIHELIHKVPDLALRFLANISSELRMTEERLCAQTDKNATERIAEAVLFLKRNFAKQTWTRKDIAEWAGTTPETVMRTLAHFESEGLISQKGRKIEIVNGAALQDLANISH